MLLSNVLKQNWLQASEAVHLIPITELVCEPDTQLPQDAQSDMDMQVHAQEILDDAHRQAAAVLEDAREQAAVIMSAAELQASELKKAATADGYQTGFAKGQDDARAELEAWKASEAKRLRELSEEMTEQYAAQLVNLQPILTTLIKQAVEQVLYRELRLAPAAIDEMVSELLTYVRQSTSVRVCVHPNDYVHAREAQPRWQAVKYGGFDLAIVPDPRLSPGDCEIWADTGHIDSTVKTRLQELGSALDSVFAAQGEAASGRDSHNVP